MTEPPLDIVLIGGASGIGKSRAAARLAEESKAFVVEFDDVVEAVQAITTAAHHPDLHLFDGVADAEADLPADRVLALQIATARALEPAVLGVVRNRLTVDVPAVVEGDYLTPAAAARAVAEGAAAGRDVRAVFLHEDDPRQITANYAAREPESGLQAARAEVSAAYGHWLSGEAALHRLPVVAPLPWSTLVPRILRALGQEDDGGGAATPW
ncbi:AAA family ATPase [Streptomyces silaceus]|uniref:AAA family ATPase n=1 Tax=Streptomyces silaceus TaxID=545123 RepID=UPI000A814A0B|nr:AAA family ATPase [Streptomyces silaceus]